MSAAESTLRDVQRRLEGKRVSSARVFLFTLQVYFEADDSSGALELWCEPAWHLRGEAGVLTGSGAIESPSSYGDAAAIAEADVTIHRAGETVRRLVGETLHSLRTGETHSLEARFSGALTVATFCDDPASETLWVLKDHGNQLAIRGTPAGLRTGSREGVV